MPSINIPTLGSKVDPGVRRAIEAIKRVLSDMETASSGSNQTILQTTIVSSEGSGEVITPPQPSSLEAVGAFDKIILTWGAPGYTGHAYTILYRSETDSFGSAVAVSTWPGMTAVDTPPDSSLAKTYYYWIRFVSTSDTLGPLNQTAGTDASTADDPSYLLEISTDKWTANTAVSAYDEGPPEVQADYVLPTVPNGYVYKCTTSGVTGNSEPAWPTTLTQTVTDGTAVWTCEQAFSFETFFKPAIVEGLIRLVIKELAIGDATIGGAKIKKLAVDDGHIANLTVTKLLAGVITASNIFLGATLRIHLDGANERIVISDGTRDRVWIGKLAGGWGIQIWDAAGKEILNSGGVQWSGITGAGKPKSKIIDSSTWQIGTYGSQPGFNQNGDSLENYIWDGVTPHGVVAPIWKCLNVTSGGPSGGWNTDTFPIDPTQTYRFSVCFMRNQADGATYLGCGSNTVRNLTTGEIDSNPYFWSGDPPEYNKWYLIVGYVYPHNFTGTTQAGGVYDMKTGEKVYSCSSFKWDAAATQSYHRAYLYYSSDTNTRQYFWDPRVELCDGTEQTTESMLMGSAIVTANSDFVQNVYPADKADLQAQIDGKIDTWYQSTDPSTSWSGTNASHAGDMWWNTSTKKLKRYSGSAWSDDLEDQKAIDAFANAATAQDTADGKRRVFVSTPVPPYDVGDMWDRGSVLGIWRCNTARAPGYSYSIAHWQVSADRTIDNTASGIVNQGGFATVDQITPSNRLTYLAEAVIDTLWLQDQAVTFPRGFYDPAIVDIPNTFVTVAERYISNPGLTGAPVAVMWSAQIKNNGGSNHGSEYQVIWSGASTLDTQPYLVSAFISSGAAVLVAGNLIFTPSFASSGWLRLQVRDTSGGGIKASTRSMTVLELKK